jgi:Amt family ammonium transporter
LPLFFSSGGCGVIDFAGSGVVHLTGGTTALIGAIIVGPRLGRFQADGTPVENFAPHNVTIQVLGVIILWFGWYGFNCGSTLAANGILASKVAVTTTLSASAALCTAVAISPFLKGHYDISLAMNAALAGLVAVTAGCPVVPDWAAIIIGILACFGFLAGSTLMLKLQIDDPVDAVGVHMCSGLMGMLYVGIFAEDSLVQAAFGETCGPTGSLIPRTGNSSGILFASQLVFCLAVMGWCTLIMAPFFFVIKKAGWLRVPPQWEEQGLDNSEHGGQRAFIGASDMPAADPRKVVNTPAAADATEKSNISTV